MDILVGILGVGALALATWTIYLHNRLASRLLDRSAPTLPARTDLPTEMAKPDNPDIPPLSQTHIASTPQPFYNQLRHSGEATDDDGKVWRLG